MNICFITTETRACRLIMDRLESESCSCYMLEDWVQLYKSLQSRECTIDIIVCDFTLIGSCYFNLFEAVKKQGHKIPLIYYNDPVPDKDTRVVHWVNQNEVNYNTKFPASLLPYLEKINEIVSDKSIRCHISLLQPAVPVGYESLKESTEGRSIDLNQFRKRNGLTPVMFHLFEYMYKNRSKELTIKELSRELFGKFPFSGVKRGNVYSYISRLRKTLVNDDEFHLDIIRTSQGCYELIVY